MTRQHLHPENDLIERFAGRVPAQAAAALYYFTGQGRTQKLIHQIKYHGQWEAGVELGRMYGEQLKVSPLFYGIDVIVPVPMFYKKQRQRGFNQAERFAFGLSEGMNVRLNTTALNKVKMTESQTRKRRLERLMNTDDAFVLSIPKAFEGKHILLADDVITTGATLQSCAQAILKELPDLKISLVALAMTKTT